MDSKSLERIRQRLHEALAACSETETPLGIPDLRKEFRESMDSLEFAAFHHERDLMMKIQNRNRLLMWEIHQALERMDSGEFGVCDECGDEIEDRRLEVQPTTRLCIHCKRHMESQGKFLREEAAQGWASGEESLLESVLMSHFAMEAD